MVDPGREWALEMFGEAGPKVRARIPEIVKDQHERSSAAQDAWGHDAQHVYGSIWHGLLKGFEEFGSLPGATTMRPGDAPYRVPVINRTTLYPWRYSHSSRTEIGATPFATSPARDALLELFQRTIQPMLSDDLEPDLGLTDEDRELLAVCRAVQAQPRTTNRLVVVAIASSIHGLHRATWGELSITEDGYPQYIGFTEDLLSLSRTGPASMAPGRTFTEGDLPRRTPEILVPESASAEDDV